MAVPPQSPIVSPQSTIITPLIVLIVRVLTLIFLLVSVIVLATDTVTVYVDLELLTYSFSTYYAYRYMMTAGVVGMAYTIIQIAFTVIYMSTGNRFGGDGLTLVDFYGDKILSYVLATGTAAGFGWTVDSNSGGGYSSYLTQANAAASILFFGFLFSAVSSVFSSFSLPKSV